MFLDIYKMIVSDHNEFEKFNLFLILYPCDMQANIILGTYDCNFNFRYTL